MEKQLSGSIALTKLQSVILEKKGKTGMVRGLFIPIDANGLEEKDGAIYLPIRALIRDEQDNYGQNGFISKNSKPSGGKKYGELTDVEKEAHNKSNPILGNVKDWSANNAPAAAIVNDDDDLPF